MCITVLYKVISCKCFGFGDSGRNALPVDGTPRRFRRNRPTKHASTVAEEPPYQARLGGRGGTALPGMPRRSRDGPPTIDRPVALAHRLPWAKYTMRLTRSCP